MVRSTFQNAVFTYRALKGDEWQLLRGIRQKALETDGVYLGGMNPGSEDALPEEKWRERIESGQKRSFGIFADNALVGTLAVFRAGDHPHVGTVGNVYVDPAYRGQWNLKELLTVAETWVQKNTHWTRMDVAHLKGNLGSMAVMRMAGFKKTHEAVGERGDIYVHYSRNIQRTHASACDLKTGL